MFPTQFGGAAGGSDGLVMCVATGVAAAAFGFVRNARQPIIYMQAGGVISPQPPPEWLTTLNSISLVSAEYSVAGATFVVVSTLLIGLMRLRDPVAERVAAREAGPE